MMLENLMDKFEKFSDKEWQDYWDQLMLKSKKPVPWGTIVQEKPKHGDLSSSDDTKLHKKRFKKNRFKKDP
jgi:hypothetical protein